MTALRYEISLRVLKIFHSFAAFTREIFFNPRREISYLQTAMSCSVHYINTNEIPNHCKRHDLLCNHSNGDLNTCEDIMFSRESSPGISLVFI